MKEGVLKAWKMEGGRELEIRVLDGNYDGENCEYKCFMVKGVKIFAYCLDFDLKVQQLLVICLEELHFTRKA